MLNIENETFYNDFVNGYSKLYYTKEIFEVYSLGSPIDNARSIAFCSAALIALVFLLPLVIMCCKKSVKSNVKSKNVAEPIRFIDFAAGNNTQGIVMPSVAQRISQV